MGDVAKAPPETWAKRWRQARAKAERHEHQARAEREHQAVALESLMACEGMTLRRAGQLLGISHQRVAQLVGQHRR